MTIDPKRVKEIFLEAAELSEDAARAAYLDEACGGDAGLRARVEALLLNHDPQGSFLGTPVAVVPDPDPAATQSLTGNPDPGGEAAPRATGENGPSDDEALSFLSPPTRPDALGRLGHYEVLQVLGRGGFGIVFRAFDEMLQRVVALKVMAPQLAATSPARKRFLREARSSAQVRHENVVQVYEVAEQPLPYLAMEFIPGETLQQKLNRVGPLDVLETLRIGRQIAEGLAAAHAMDLIHRDIKPGNVLLEGGQHKVKITDFGLARTADDASISQSGIIAGTPMYMAPEQAQGQTLDQRADLFSLGSVLYQMVAGRPPFRANSAVAVLKRVAEDTPRAIREIIPEAPQWLCDIIAKLHAKNPDDRYQSAREVADVLADCEAQLKANAKLKDYSRIPRSKAPRSGRRRWVAAAVAVLLPVIALVVTEFAGVTHLFRGQEARNDETEGWVQLFNGKDLSGWKKHPIKPGFWRVDENGHLVGAGPVDKYAFLGTERDDFENFHLRLEAMVDTPESDSGVFFRVPFHFEGGGFSEINISPARSGAQTGSLLVAKERWEKYGDGTWYPAATGLTKPKEWFILEIIANGDHLVTKVNGKLALDSEVPIPNRRGHIFLQQQGGWTIVRFRKIEIKELPPPTTPAPLKYGDPEYTNSLGMKFKLIPAGKFTMGSSPEEIARCLKQPGPYKGNLPTEGPEHPVEITQPFYLGATEVTVGQFRQFVDEQGYQVGDGRWRNPEFDQTDQHPVVFVSWNNAVDFSKWLSKKEGKEYRLPTEAEWEYSCRAGKAGSRYGFGDDDAQLKDYAWFYQNSGGGTHPVGKKKPNAWGLYDMHGNAFEWCQDNADPHYYKNSPVKDPPGGAGGGRVSRGGSHKFGPVLCRSAFRGYLGPDDHRGAGFRVLLVSPPASIPTESGAMAAKKAQAAVAKRLGIPVETTNSIGMKLRFIPPGKFMMGSSKEEIDFWLKRGGNDWVNDKLLSEGPQHEVELTRPFYMGQTEVTVGQFRQFVQATGYQMKGGAWHFGKFYANKNWLNPGFAQTDDHPVVCVNWNDAVDFCNWLSKKEGKSYRLPTEAEWEYSCRAGSKGRWSFGDYEGDSLNYARFYSNSQGHTWPVAGLKANVWGLHDMHGNAWEWCRDIYDVNYYKTSTPKDPRGPGAGGERVMRGGAWCFHPGQCRSAFRVRNTPDARCDDEGFRVVLVVSAAAGAGTESGTMAAKKAQEASAKQLGIPVETTNSNGMKLRFIPAGKFMMGSSKEEIDFWLKKKVSHWEEHLHWEAPQHEVEITQPFYMGQTEVTVGQFRQFVKATGYKTQAEREGGAYRGFPNGEYFKEVANTDWLNPGFAQTDDHPVVCVSWNDALEFCQWLSKQEASGVAPALRGTYRLPTEAEWEYSCRAGSKGRWSFGDNEGELWDYARDGGNAQNHSWPVAGLKANPWGLYDMHGNVTEGCQDVFDRNYYKTSPPKDPPGPAAGDACAIRGGSWLWHEAHTTRSAMRYYANSANRANFAGFRVVLVVSSPKTKTPPLAVGPFTDADVQRIAALPAEQQIEEVRKELKRRNPGFDGKMETKIEGGVVTKVQIVTDKVMDIAPIRVFDALRVLVCSGTLTYDGPGPRVPASARPNGLLADLTPLQGMNLTGLTHLGLWNTKVSDAGLAYFKDCKGLRHLGLGYTKVSDAGLANFKDCKNLIQLWVHNTPVGDAGLAHFHDCKDLADLNLAGTKVSDVGLAPFKDCKNLKYLWLDRTQVGDAGLALFKGISLRALSIDSTRITDLTPLQGMTLEEIRLTPKNITRGLDIIRGMKSLKTIGIAWQQTWPAAEFWKRYDKGEFK